MRKLHDPRGRCTTKNRSSSSTGGFSLIESTVGMFILVVAACGLVSSLVGSAEVASSNRESSLAQLAARGELEALRSTEFSLVFSTFNETPADDPNGPGTARGAGFAVPGLDPQQGDPDGLPGRVVFPRLAGDAATLLKETVPDPTFSMPRDLNGDGLIDANDRSADYALLPVRVVIEWRGSGGSPRRIEFETLLANR